jgi:hypothetical protein
LRKEGRLNFFENRVLRRNSNNEEIHVQYFPPNIIQGMK